MTGHGGWPLTAFLDPEGVPFYGGTYFPPEPRQGMPSFRMVMEAVVESWAHAARARSAPRRRGSASSSRRSAGWSPPRSRSTPSWWAPPSARLRAMADLRHGGFGGAPKFPPAAALELLLAHGVNDVVELTLDAMAARRHPRPDRRRLRPLLGRRGLARPPLREDALRQRAARPRLPARLAGARARALAAGRDATRSTGRCARCAGPRAASTRRSTPTPRARRAASTSGRPEQVREALGAAGLGDAADEVIALLRGHRAGQLRGPQHPPPARRAGRGAARAPGRGTPGAPRAAGRTRLAGPRRQAPCLVERPDDRGARRGRRRPGPRATTWTPRGRCAEFVWTQMRSGDGRLLRSWKDGEARLDAYLEDYAYLVEALLTLYEATFERALVRRRARDGRPDDRAVRRLRARRLLHHRPRPRAADRAPQGRRRPSDPLGQLLRRLRPAAPRRADRRARVRAPCGRRPAPAAPRGGPSSARRSPTCFAPWTSTSPRSRRWRSWPRPAARAEAPSAEPRRPPSCARPFAPTWCSRAGAEGTERPELMRERSAVDGQAGRLRVRELRLPAPGHRARGARGGPGLNAPPGARRRPRG